MISHRGRALIIWATIFTFLDIVTLGLRFYTLRIQRRSLRADDYLIVVAVASMLALVGCSGWGRFTF